MKRLVMIIAVAAMGCSGPTSASVTVLAGTVTRGPVTPVCSPDVPCDVPFSAGFSVRSGTRTVATFRSDADGHFEVGLAPGDYTIVADADAPIISPGSQVKPVTVLQYGVTTVHLDFDTGIR